MWRDGVGLGGAALFFVAAAAAATAAGLPRGDGIGLIDDYDPARKMLTVGTTAVYLTPSAAVSLDKQLAREGWSRGKRFGAKYNIVNDPGGQAVIDDIHVFRTKRQN